MNSVKTTPINKISLVCVPTREQDRAIAFYESLGFEKRTDTTFGPGYRWVEVYPPQGSTGVALAPPPGNDPVAPANTGITLTTNDIDASHAQFKALGVDVDHEVSRMGDPVRRCSGSAIRAGTRSWWWSRSPERGGYKRES